MVKTQVAANVRCLRRVIYRILQGPGTEAENPNSEKRRLRTEFWGAWASHTSWQAAGRAGQPIAPRKTRLRADE